MIEYGLSRSPMANIKPAPRIRPDPKGVSLEDVRAIFQVTSQNIYGARDRAILMFLLDTGCRAQGICTLRYDNLELDQKRAILGEKGRPNRAVFLSDLTIDFLTAWLELRPVNAITVFCSVQPPRTGNPLTYDGLKEIMRRLKERAHVEGRVNLHSFRHGFAREYIKNGGDLATLSRLMGHADSAVTSWYYAVFSSGELATAHDKFSPIKGLGNVE